MRKNILRICIVALLALAVLAVSVVAVTGKMNLFVSEDGTELPKSFNIDFLDRKDIHIAYDKSEGTADIYKDEKGNEYIYKNGKLTGYYSNVISHTANGAAPIGKEAAAKTAAEWLTQFTKHPEKYELQSFDENERYGQYDLVLARKAGEIFTDECADITVMYNGQVHSVSVSNDGKYDGVSKKVAGGMTEESVRSYADSLMKLIYPDKDGGFVMERYSLKQDENGYYVSICGKMNDSLEFLRYYPEKTEPDSTFPEKPDKIIAGTGGVEKEILPGDKAFDKIVSFVRERAGKSDAFGVLRLAVHDPETEKHLSYELRESETFVELIYDECKEQSFNMMQSGGGSAEEEKEIKRIFLSLTGEEHNDIFISHDDEYKSAATLGSLTDVAELITYVNDFVKK